TVFYQEAMYLQPEYEQIIRKKREEFRFIIKAVIEEGKEKGEFREEIDVEIVVMAILGIVNWTHQWYNKEGHKTIEEISAIFNDFILHAILKQDVLKN